MATLVKAPVAAPDIDYRSPEKWAAQEQAYIDTLVALATRANKGGIVGETVRFQIADGYAVYVVWSERPLQLVHVNTGDGYAISGAHMRGLTLADVRALVGQERAWQGIMDEHDAFISGLPLGAIVHYNNGFGQFIRCERVEGERGKRLMPIALIGNWSDYDLPRRNVDGSVTLGYNAERIVNRDPFEPNYSSIWEAKDDKGKAWFMRGLNPDGSPPAHLNEVGRARFAEQRYQKPFDPAAEPPVDLTPPPPPEGEARALAAYVQQLRAIESAIGDTPRTLDEAKAKYAAVRNLVVADYQLPEPVL